MKNLLTTSLIFLISSVAAFSQPNTLWTQTIGGEYDEIGVGIIQTEDGGYAVTGVTYSFGSVGGDAYLVKVDSVGNEEWSRTFGGSGEDFCRRIRQTNDGGYILVGGTESYGAGGIDIYLVKTDNQGNEEWMHTFGGADDDGGYGVEQTSDNGFIIAGQSESFGAGGSCVYLIKTDSTGNSEWTRYLGGSGWDGGSSVQQTTDGGYIIAGVSDSYGSSEQVYLLKTDWQGYELWSETFGGGSNEWAEFVQQTSDGGYIIVGATNSDGAGSRDVYLIKTNSFGDLLWSETFGGASMESGITVQQTSDEGYIIAGYSFSFGAGNGDVYVIKTDINGDEEWSQTYGDTGEEIGIGVRQTEDEGYIISGYTYSYGAGGSDVYVIRLEGNPAAPVTVSLTLENPPIIIPASGGSFDFNIEVSNNTAEPQTFDLWTQIYLPGTGVVQPMNVPGLTLGAGVSADRDRTQVVPQNAPGGLYNYYAYVGEYPWVVDYYDSFTFEKEGTDRGWFGDASEWVCFGETFSGEEITKLTPRTFSIDAYPNPFNASTTLSFDLPVIGDVSLIVYDITGRIVEVLHEGYLITGSHRMTFDGSTISSGIYFARLSAGKEVRTEKMVLIK